MYVTQKLAKMMVILSTAFYLSVTYATNLTIVTEHLAPFQIVKSELITGFSTEIVKATLDKSGIDYKIEAYPWSTSFNRTLHEENICIYSLARIPERELLFKWVGHITKSTISFYTLKSKSIKIDNLNDAKKYKTAVIKDDVTHHFLLSKGFVENENLYVMRNYDALLQLLEIPSRQIDLVILNDDLINSRLKNKENSSKYSNVHMLDELTLDFYFACSLNTEKKIVNKLTTIMKKLEASGVHSIIRNKWQKKMVNLVTNDI